MFVGIVNIGLSIWSKLEHKIWDWERLRKGVKIAKLGILSGHVQKVLQPAYSIQSFLISPGEE